MGPKESETAQRKLIRGLNSTFVHYHVEESYYRFSCIIKKNKLLLRLSTHSHRSPAIFCGMRKCFFGYTGFGDLEIASNVMKKKRGASRRVIARPPRGNKEPYTSHLTVDTRLCWLDNQCLSIRRQVFSWNCWSRGEVVRGCWNCIILFWEDEGIAGMNISFFIGIFRRIVKYSVVGWEQSKASSSRMISRFGL